MAVLGTVLRVAVLVVAAVVVLVVFLFATDYGLAATVTKRDCAANPPAVTVTTKTFGITHAMPVTSEQCGVIRQGNYVVYHVRSQHTIIYEHQGGRCMYDTNTMVC